ncbi:MAG: transposase [Alphaproteobacteria bacterium]|jgi:putative transposase|nr:transposase [Alphaproteobacteria bacterium]OJV12539.1 MAG: hypothetical protein BGO27_03345 [Alphaproteobacteria bacterium 33-17]
MELVKAYCYRLKTNDEIEQKLFQFAGCCRFVWNKALGIQKQRKEEGQKYLPYEELAKELTLWKKEEELVWLKDAPSQSLQQTLKDLDKAIWDVFKVKGRQDPRFKKKGVHYSFRYPQGVKIDNRRIFLPKIGFVGFFISKEVEGTIKNTTVSKEGNHWYVSIQTECEVEEPRHSHNDKVIGLDFGVVDSIAAASSGDMPKAISSFRLHQNKFALEQRKLARKEKFSQNWYKQKKKISALHNKIKNIRKDYLQKLSTTISKSHGVVVIEDLKISNLTKSAKGTIEEPGRNVKAKSGLNKAILDQGWHNFTTMLEYKQKWLGGKLIKIDPKYTSQKCSSCSHVSQDNRPKREIFECVECAYQDHADINAAKNIRAAGHAVMACGSNQVIGRKQESVEMSNHFLPVAV